MDKGELVREKGTGAVFMEKKRKNGGSMRNGDEKKRNGGSMEMKKRRMEEV